MVQLVAQNLQSFRQTQTTSATETCTYNEMPLSEDDEEGIVVMVKSQHKDEAQPNGGCEVRGSKRIELARTSYPYLPLLPPYPPPTFDTTCITTSFRHWY
jgi:hypothetical protein